MKKFLLIFLCLAHYISWAQITPRHILEKAYSIEKVKENLIPLKNYKPYPTSVEDWKKVVPDSIIQQVIKNGE